MEEATENGKESSHSARANGMDESMNVTDGVPEYVLTNEHAVLYFLSVCLYNASNTTKKPYFPVDNARIIYTSKGQNS
jgi:hypothetical protein